LARRPRRGGWQWQHHDAAEHKSRRGASPPPVLAAGGRTGQDSRRRRRRAPRCKATSRTQLHHQGWAGRGRGAARGPQTCSRTRKRWGEQTAEPGAKQAFGCCVLVLVRKQASRRAVPCASVWLTGCVVRCEGRAWHTSKHGGVFFFCPLSYARGRMRCVALRWCRFDSTTTTTTTQPHRTALHCTPGLHAAWGIGSDDGSRHGVGVGPKLE
jgi:hypothetical protein